MLRDAESIKKGIPTATMEDEVAVAALMSFLLPFIDKEKPTFPLLVDLYLQMGSGECGKLNTAWGWQFSDDEEATAFYLAIRKLFVKDSHVSTKLKSNKLICQAAMSTIPSSTTGESFVSVGFCGEGKSSLEEEDTTRRTVMLFNKMGGFVRKANKINSSQPIAISSPSSSLLLSLSSTSGATSGTASGIKRLRDTVDDEKNKKPKCEPFLSEDDISDLMLQCAGLDKEPMADLFKILTNIVNTNRGKPRVSQDNGFSGWKFNSASDATDFINKELKIERSELKYGDDKKITLPFIDPWVLAIETAPELVANKPPVYWVQLGLCQKSSDRLTMISTQNSPDVLRKVFVLMGEILLLDVSAEEMPLLLVSGESKEEVKTVAPATPILITSEAKVVPAVTEIAAAPIVVLAPAVIAVAPPIVALAGAVAAIPVEATVADAVDEFHDNFPATDFSIDLSIHGISSFLSSPISHLGVAQPAASSSSLFSASAPSMFSSSSSPSPRLPAAAPAKFVYDCVPVDFGLTQKLIEGGCNREQLLNLKCYKELATETGWLSALEFFHVLMGLRPGGVGSNRIMAWLRTDDCPLKTKQLKCNNGESPLCILMNSKLREYCDKFGREKLDCEKLESEKFLSLMSLDQATRRDEGILRARFFTEALTKLSESLSLSSARPDTVAPRIGSISFPPLSSAAVSGGPARIPAPKCVEAAIGLREKLVELGCKDSLLLNLPCYKDLATNRIWFKTPSFYHALEVSPDAFRKTMDWLVTDKTCPLVTEILNIPPTEIMPTHNEQRCILLNDDFVAYCGNASSSVGKMASKLKFLKEALRSCLALALLDPMPNIDAFLNTLSTESAPPSSSPFPMSFLSSLPAPTNSPRR